MGLEINLVVPDLWQQEAVRALQAGKDVVVHAPTGAGKTYIFELLYPSLKGQAVFTVPTRALANDKLAEWRDARLGRRHRDRRPRAESRRESRRRHARNPAGALSPARRSAAARGR